MVVRMIDGNITTLLASVHAGDRAAAERLWQIVHAEVRRVAQARLAREGNRNGLQTTVLVQEAYLRLFGPNQGDVPLANRRHFFAAAANAMQQFLVDDARRRASLKRGGNRQRSPLSDVTLSNRSELIDHVALAEALSRLRANDERKAEIVTYRFYTGLSIDETAELIGVSSRQVDKEWRFAKAWLHRELYGDD